jgi:hypothetical protein
MDPGVTVTDLGLQIMPGDSIGYPSVRLTFDAEAGDTPGDTYQLFIDPETHLLNGVRYYVTYAAVVPEGVPHTPENYIVFDSHDTVDGLVVPTHYVNHHLADQTPFLICTVTDWSFRTPFEPLTVAMPEGAVVDTTTP